MMMTTAKCVEHALGNQLYVYISNNCLHCMDVQEGLARLERCKRWDTRERKTALQNLEQFQDKAKKERLRIWQYGDAESDEEEQAPAGGNPGGRR
jgi:hypothetical protein